MIANAEKISSALALSYNEFNGEDEEVGVLVRLKNILEEVKSVSSFDDMGEVSKNLANAVYTLEECSQSIKSSLDSVEFNPVLLEETEERIDLLSKLMKKYSVDEKGLLLLLEELKDKLSKIDSSAQRIEQLTDELDAAGTKMLDAAEKLTSSRMKAADTFTKRVAEELSFLDMPDVTFLVDRKDKPLGATGKDDIEFLISANKGEDAKVAIRNIRRDAMDKAKDMKKNGEMTEDEQKASEKNVQDLTDKYIKDIDGVTSKKEKEIMQI